MISVSEFVLRSVLIGVGATVALDLWSLLIARAFAAPPPNWALVGRWMGHLPRGRLVHDSIAGAARVPGERIIGWTAHYAIGVAFAALLLAVGGPDWLRAPTLLPALVVGVATVAAPFFILQPGMGAGVMSTKTPDPTAARLRSLLNHAVFGLGLYLAGRLSALLPA